ncbi:MAG: hypothetical protein CMH30_02290 [Micavibrio sp.]|nr:hypothetical protein [Micavibrio sp.]
MGETKTINRTGLVLQGGGAVSAFTYGALLRLLEDNRINIHATAGASGGGINSLCIAAGRNNTERAQLLHRLWDNIALDTMPMRHLSDYPFIHDVFRWPNIPALEGLLADKVMKAEVPYLQECLRNALNNTLTPEFWSHVRSGKTKLFVNAAEELPNGELKNHPIPQEEMRAKYAIGTAALDFMGAVKHKGKTLRDGAYVCNPDMSGIEQEDLTDIIAITLHGAPKKSVIAEAQQETARLNPTFRRNAAVKKAEIHGHLTHLLDQEERTFKLHEIAFIAPRHYRDSARLNNSREHITLLRDQGYAAADKWLKENRHLLGRADTYTAPANVIRSKRQLRVA